MLHKDRLGSEEIISLNGMKKKKKKNYIVTYNDKVYNYQAILMQH